MCFVNNFDRESAKDHKCLNTFKSGQCIFRKSFLSFHCESKEKAYSPQLAAMFLMDKKTMNNFGSGSAKDHFCQIVFESWP